mgnify:CR=1 FL=1
MSNSCSLWSAVCVSQGLDVNTSLLQVLVVLEWVESLVVVLVWRAVVLLERSVGFASLEVLLHLSSEVPLGKQAEVWHPVVVGGGLVVPGVLEVGSMGVRKVEWHVGVSIVDSIQLLSVHEPLQVVFDNWALSVGCVLSSCSLSLDSITESEDVLESLMLEGVWVHINQASVVSDTG